MSFEVIKKFFRDIELWQQVVAGVLVVLISAIAMLLIRIFKRKPKQLTPTNGSLTTIAPESPSQVATGHGTSQEMKIDRSYHEGISIHVESGSTFNLTIINYEDGLNQAENPKVRSLFKEGHICYKRKNLTLAIDKFQRCLELEKDHEKLSALNVQIGNCYYELRFYVKAAEFYATGLREARKANDIEGEASNLLNIGNTYLQRSALDGLLKGDNILRAVEYYRKAILIFLKDEYPVEYAMTQNNLGNAYMYLPAATPEERVQNVRNAVECYQAALEIYRRDEYPIDYAMTQNSLGNAYMYLPAATPEERVQNVRNAVECYQAALEIYRRDDFPQDFCITAANIGMSLASINDTKACHWLREAYALREYLPDQGKQLEKLIREVCDG